MKGGTDDAEINESILSNEVNKPYAGFPPIRHLISPPLSHHRGICDGDFFCTKIAFYDRFKMYHATANQVPPSQKGLGLG